jgi:catechol 2,3-dioxygenase-like lactoylglutathione lyase family enzyme
MKTPIPRLATDERSATERGDGQISRRRFLISLPAMALVPKMAEWMPQAQTLRAPLALRELNHFALFVADAQRSRAFYQGLFGMPIQAVQGTGGTLLRVGTGIQYIALAGVGGAGRQGVIDHFSINMETFSVDAVMKAFAGHGMTRSDTPSTAPMTAWLRMRGEAQGGAPEGTGELYFNDPDGIKGQVQDPSYCGGAGVLGNVCPPLPQAAGLGGAPITLRALSHFTLTTTNPERSLEFYQGLFGMPIQARQGNTPLLRIGPGPQFVALAGGPNAKPGINHFCMTMDHFDPERVMKILADHGVARSDKPSTAPMTSWLRMRSEGEGGGPNATVELHFNDPDGITVQLQDASYCGGSGVLGNVCP